MPTPRYSPCALALALAALGGGCVSAYDPSTATDTPLATRAEAVGHERPRTRAPRWRPPAQAAPSDAPPRDARPGDAAPTQDAAATPAAKEIAWIIELLNGARAAGPRGMRTVESHLSPELARQVPPREFLGVIAQIRRDVLADGPATLERLSPGDVPQRATALVRAPRSGQYLQIALSTDERGKIAAVSFVPVAATAVEGLPTWTALERELSTWVTGSPSTRRAGLSAVALADPAKGSASLTTIRASASGRALPIGLAIRGVILATIAEQINAGQRRWTDEIVVLDALKSLPPGQTQLEREGTRLTIATLAERMMELGDLTATDHLLHAAGRQNVEATMARLGWAEDRNVPILSTMDRLRILFGPDTGVAERWISAGEAERRAMLEPGGAVATQPPVRADGPIEAPRPGAGEIGWDASPEELSRLMAELVRLRQADTTGTLARLLPRAGPDVEGPVWRETIRLSAGEPGLIVACWAGLRADGRWVVVSTVFSEPGRVMEEARLRPIAAAAMALAGRWSPETVGEATPIRP